MIKFPSFWNKIGSYIIPLFPVSMNSQKIYNVLDPTNNQEAATKKYVDDNAGGGAWNLIVDQAITAQDRVLIEGLAGDTERIYKFVIEGTRIGGSDIILRPNSDGGANYEYSQHEAGYFSTHLPIHGVDHAEPYAGLKIFHNQGRGAGDTANVIIRGMLHAVDTGRVRQCLTEVALWWNDGMACRQDLWAVWLNVADEITSLQFWFFQQFTGHLYIFALA